MRARAQGKLGILVPPDNAAEAAVVAGLQVIPVQNLREAVSFLEGGIKLSPTKVDVAQIFERTRNLPAYVALPESPPNTQARETP